MRVLQVIDKLNVGGAERVAVDISIFLSNRNEVDVAFLSLLEPSVLDVELQEKGIKVLYLNRKNKYSIFKLHELFLILNRYEIIHVHSRHVLKYIGLTFILYYKRKYKVIFHDHYGRIHSDKKLSLYLKFCIRNSHLYIGVSETLTNWAKANKVNKNIFLLGNVISLNKTKIELKDCGDIVVVGNFRSEKNYKFLCYLAKSLPSNITIDLYANITDSKYYSEILKLIDELEIKSKIKIILGKTNIVHILNNYKVAMHCASSETGPLVAIEYMSQKIPLIMYDTGEVAKIIKENDYPFLLSNYEIPLWKSSLLKLIDNEDVRHEMANLLFDIYLTKFSEKSYVQKCINIYNKTML